MDNISKAQSLSKQLRSYLENIEAIRCRLAISVLTPEGKPKIGLYPHFWSEEIGLNYDALDAYQTIGGMRRPRANITTFKGFLPACGECGRALQEAIHTDFAHRLKLLYGRKTMTVNARPEGLLLRIGNKHDIRGECIYQISDLLNIAAWGGKNLIKEARIDIPPKRDDEFIFSILELLLKFADRREGKISPKDL